MDQEGQPAATGVEFQLGVAKHTNGKHWVSLGIMIGGIGVFTVGLPPTVAEQLADSLPKELKHGANEARRLDNPLIIAQDIPEQGANRHEH